MMEPVMQMSDMEVMHLMQIQQGEIIDLQPYG